MDTKEAIELVNSNTYIVAWERKDIISLLKKGEAYKQIVEEMESVHCGEDGEFGYNRRKLVNKLKQKYFPKEKDIDTLLCKYGWEDNGKELTYNSKKAK